jgi:hypothetical protein
MKRTKEMRQIMECNYLAGKIIHHVIQAQAFDVDSI